MNELTLKNYIDAVSESANRVRTVLYILIVACIVTYGTAQLDWTDDRIQVAANQMYYGLWYPPLQKLPSRNITQLDLAIVQAFQKENPSAPYGSVSNVGELQKIVSNPDFHQAQVLAADNQYKDQDELQKYMESLIDERAKSHVNFTLPVFGTTFDYNDLGALAGFSFAVILILLRSSLFRHVSNLRLTFMVARGQDAPESHDQAMNAKLLSCYEFMSMSQVFTVPPQRGQQEFAVWRHIPKLLYVLPLITHAFIVWEDLQSYALVKPLDPALDWKQTVVEMSFLFIIAALTYSCLSLSVQMDRLWRTQAKDLKLTALPMLDGVESGDPENASDQSALDAAPA